MKQANIEAFKKHLKVSVRLLTMLSPDSVSLVTPPRAMAPHAMHAMPPSQ